MQFLEFSVQERHEMAPEIGAMAFFNLAVNNNMFVSYSIKCQILGRGIMIDGSRGNTAAVWGLNQ